MFLNIKLDDWQKQYCVFASLLFSVLVFTVPERGHINDTACWLNWIRHIKSYGLTNIYETDTEYLPAFHYILYLFSLTKDSFEEVQANIKYLKLFIFPFHLGSSYLVFHILRRWVVGNYWAYGVFYLINIAVLHNTLVWGQVDEIISFFMIVSIYFLLNQNTSVGLIAFIMAINFKYQAIVFLPVVLLLLISIYAEKGKRQIISDIGAIFLMQILIFSPFILAGKLGEIWRVVSTLVDSQPYVSSNAYNMWFAILGKEAKKIKDSETFIIFTYKQWGLCLFFIFSFIVLLPVFVSMVRKIILKKGEDVNRHLVILTCGVLPFIFFFFCTQMHERYGHSAIIFLVLYSLLSRKWLVGFLASLAYLLNIEGVMRSLTFQNYGVTLFDARLIALIFLLVIILSLRDIYKISYEDGLWNFSSRD